MLHSSALTLPTTAKKRILPLKSVFLTGKLPSSSHTAQLELRDKPALHTQGSLEPWPKAQLLDRAGNLDPKGKNCWRDRTPHMLASSGHEHGTNSVLNSKTQSLPAPLATAEAGVEKCSWYTRGAWRRGCRTWVALQQDHGATCATSPICAVLLPIPLPCS